jgi:hypothetical protein
MIEAKGQNDTIWVLEDSGRGHESRNVGGLLKLEKEMDSPP